MTGPLEGIVVLELGSFITGPYAGMVLAELGADIIKIEPPGTGDAFRNHDGSGYSAPFCAYNRGKKSVTLDLTQPAGRDVFMRLVPRADILIENFRPGVAEKLGLADAILTATNPRLIHCAITGFGKDGPYAKRPAYDTVAQAVSGLLGQFLDPEHPRIAGPAIGDAITGLYAVIGILAALVERASTGRGRRVDVAMLEALMAFAAEPFANYFRTGIVPKPFGRAAVSQSFALPCADGRLIGIHLSSPPKFWDGLVDAVERPDLKQDTRFATHAARVQNFDALSDILAAIFGKRGRAEWEERLSCFDVPFAPINDLAETADDPQVRHLGTVIDLDHPKKGRVRAVNSPIFFDGHRDADSTAPPVLGEHTNTVLKDAGLSDAEIRSLRDNTTI